MMVPSLLSKRRTAADCAMPSEVRDNGDKEFWFQAVLNPNESLKGGAAVLN